ncbi:MAG: acyltransferase [Prevotellaceae bacterium]|nr:acyltransferase [Prevotellaceae bacterium]
MSRQTVQLLKGIGIMLIIAHNYTHWLPECVDENEYTFSVERINKLVLYLEQGGPHVLLNIMSHFGHYGVAIFLFVSGYGLTKKYERPGEERPKFFAFIFRHAVKLWKLMIPAVLIFLAIEMYRGTWNRPLDRLLPLLGFYSNLQVKRDLILGPWWWFGLMMQLYVVWRIFICGRGKKMLYAVIALCLIAQIAVTWIERGNLVSTDTTVCYLHYNFPCSMLAFGLGVAHSRYDLEWLRGRWSPFVGTVILIVGAFNAGIWCISSVGILMIVIALFGNESKPSPVVDNTYSISWRHVFSFLGTISPWLFALHPIVRAYTIKIAMRDGIYHVYLSLLIYFGATILSAWLFSIATNKKSLSPHNKKHLFQL